MDGWEALLLIWRCSEYSFNTRYAFSTSRITTRARMATVKRLKSHLCASFPSATSAKVEENILGCWNLLLFWLEGAGKGKIVDPSVDDLDAFPSAWRFFDGTSSIDDFCDKAEERQGS